MSGLERFVTPPRRPRRRDGRSTPEAEQLPGPLRHVVDPDQRPDPGTVCELCATPIDDHHRHVVEVEQRAMLCSCRACALLFDRDDAGTGGYRTVPEDHLRVEPFVLAPEHWAGLQIPVGMAFVMLGSARDGPVAFYPSPGGATESELSLDAWDDLVAANPPLGDLDEDVEAALIRTDVDEPDCHIVPIDRCYELVGELRMHWKGFDGGTEVRERIGAFFADLEERARPVGVAQ